MEKVSSEIYWYGLGSEPLLETDWSGNIQNEYIFLGAQRIARRDSGGNAYYYLGDHLGSSRMIFTSSGSKCYDADFGPFGKEAVYTGTCSQNYKFTGKERDSETRNDYFGARFNESNLGRFMSPDLIKFTRDLSDPQSWNKYSYSFNRPTVLVDIDGAWPTWFHHEVIEDVFVLLGPHAITVLENASDWVDSSVAGNQAPERAYIHGMRDGADNQSVEEAREKSADYIDSQLKDAVSAQVGYENGGGKGYSDAALNYFGHALHTATDMTSPAHADFQAWSCAVCWSGLDHFRRERRSATSSNMLDEEARYDARMAAYQIWQRFQKELETERKKYNGSQCKDKDCPKP